MPASSGSQPPPRSLCLRKLHGFECAWHLTYAPPWLFTLVFRRQQIHQTFCAPAPPLVVLQPSIPPVGLNCWAPKLNYDLSWALIVSAARSESAAMVEVGFAVELVGNT